MEKVESSYDSQQVYEEALHEVLKFLKLKDLSLIEKLALKRIAIDRAMRAEVAHIEPVLEVATSFIRDYFEIPFGNQEFYASIAKIRKNSYEKLGVDLWPLFCEKRQMDKHSI
ncbi:hypothetical protein KJ632_01965 [Patescibacteria group bacterium]|nr:hypothetical protein [Patescibacteria group bacterium]